MSRVIVCLMHVSIDWDWFKDPQRDTTQPILIYRTVCCDPISVIYRVTSLIAQIGSLPKIKMIRMHSTVPIRRLSSSSHCGFAAHNEARDLLNWIMILYQNILIISFIQLSFYCHPYPLPLSHHFLSFGLILGYLASYCYFCTGLSL